MCVTWELIRDAQSRASSLSHESKRVFEQDPYATPVRMTV